MFCLESIARQTFTQYEIIVVNDGSTGTDLSGRSCKEIVRQFHKNHRKIKLNYIEHKKNKGLLETRRTAVYEARGEYIFSIDSDDFLCETALETLIRHSENNSIDIVQGASVFGRFPNDEIEAELSLFMPCKINKCSTLHTGKITGDLCYEGFVKAGFSLIICGKLIRRECYLEALDKIPPAYCNMNEEIVQMFFILYFAKSYAGADTLIYYYRDCSGMTSSDNKLSLQKFEVISSSAVVYTVIYMWLEEQRRKNGTYPVCDEIVASIKESIRQKVKTGLENIRNLDEEDKPKAYEILCDIWGEKLVKTMEETSVSD